MLDDTQVLTETQLYNDIMNPAVHQLRWNTTPLTASQLLADTQRLEESQILDTQVVEEHGIPFYPQITEDSSSMHMLADVKALGETQQQYLDSDIQDFYLEQMSPSSQDFKALEERVSFLERIVQEQSQHIEYLRDMLSAKPSNDTMSDSELTPTRKRMRREIVVISDNEDISS